MNAAEFKILLTKAEAGDADAMYEIALAFKEGNGTSRDLGRFFEWINKSANAGNPDAMIELALAYTDDNIMVPNPEDETIYKS